MTFVAGNQAGKGRKPGSKNKKTLARIATVKRVLEQGIDLPAHTKLTPEDLAIAVQLIEGGETQAAVAEKLGVDQSTISRTLSQFEDTRSLAKRKLQASALKLTDIAIAASVVAGEIGNAEPALELLDRLEVAPRRDVGGQGSGQRVIVVVGSGASSALPAVIQ